MPIGSPVTPHKMDAVEQVPVPCGQHCDVVCHRGDLSNFRHQGILQSLGVSQCKAFCNRALLDVT